MTSSRLRGVALGCIAVISAGLASVASYAESSPTGHIARVKPAVVLVETNSGWGTGFFVSKDGVLLTNNHVIQDAQRVTVIYRNRERLDAKVLATDTLSDLAVLKVDSIAEFPTVVLGDSDDVQEGMPVAVTGYPLPDVLVKELGTSLQSCTTVGAVSALRRSAVPGVTISRPLLQYDAASTHGNSGGPIYKLDNGDVVGIVRWTVGDGGFLNLGVPINEAKLLLHKAGVVPQANVLDPSWPECQVAPGDISLLNTIGPDKALTSRLADAIPFQLEPRSLSEAYDQVMSNAGYLSCFGKFAPPVSAPVLVDGRLVLTGNDGRVRVYDPSQPLGDQPARAIFNVENRFMFFPAAGTSNQICFSAGTPTFAVKEKVDEAMAILSILSAATGGPIYSAARMVATIDAKGSIFAVNPRSGNLDWEYEVGFAGTPVLADGKVYFGGLGVYGALDATSGREIWAAREKLGGRATKWYTVALGDGVLYVLVTPIRVELVQVFPGFSVLGDGDMKLTAVSAADGKRRWETKVVDIGGQVNPLAAALAADAENGRIYVARNRQAWAFSAAGQPLWSCGEAPKKKAKERDAKEVMSLLTRFSSRIAFDEDSLYIGGDDGRLYCLSSTTGTERWTFTGLGEIGEATLIDGMLFCGSSNGWMYAADPVSGQLRWKVNVGSAIVGQPVVRDGILYFASQVPGTLTGRLHSVFMPRTEG